MKDTRLIKLFKTFSREELKAFEKFLQSPFLKPARDTSELYNYIIKFYPDYEDSKLEKERVFRKLFDKESYNEKKLQNLIFDLTKAAEDFLSYNTLMKNEIEFLLNLSKGYLDKNLSDESNRVNKIIEKKLKPGFSQGKDYISKFRRLTYLKSSYYTGISDFEKLIDCKRKYFEALAVQFFIDYTEIVGSIIPVSETYGQKLENNFIESVIKSFDMEKLLRLLEKSEYENKYLILLQYYRLKTYKEPDDFSNYFLLRDTIYELLEHLDREEKYILFSDLVNYCVQKYEVEEIDFKKECLAVYKKMLENDAYSYSENESMQVMAYRNILIIAITQRDIEWLEIFVKKYSECLQPEYREDLKNLSLANVSFIKKDFDKALTYVSKINHEFFLFKVDLKNLMLRIYLELNYFEQAFSMVDSFKHFLSNSKEITSSYRKSYSVFLKFYLDILKIKCGQSKESASFLKKQIEKNSDTIQGRWLLEKANELVSKN